MSAKKRKAEERFIELESKQNEENAMDFAEESSTAIVPLIQGGFNNHELLNEKEITKGLKQLAHVCRSNLSSK